MVKLTANTKQQLDRVAVVTCDCCRTQFKTIERDTGIFFQPSWLRLLSPSTAPHEDLDFCDKCTPKVLQAVRAVCK